MSNFANTQKQNLRKGVTMPKVAITQQQAARSEQIKKEKTTRTIHQQQVFRTAQNLFYVMAQMRKTCPVKYRAVLDPTYTECTQLLVALSVAYADPMARIPQLTLAAAHLDAIRTIMGMLRSMGNISKDDFKKAKSLAMSCTQQTLAWRASAMVRVSQSNQATA